MVLAVRTSTGGLKPGALEAPKLPATATGRKANSTMRRRPHVPERLRAYPVEPRLQEDMAKALARRCGESAPSRRCRSGLCPPGPAARAVANLDHQPPVDPCGNWRCPVNGNARLAHLPAHSRPMAAARVEPGRGELPHLIVAAALVEGEPANQPGACAWNPC